MTVEQQREVVREKINDINETILGVERRLITAKAEELPDISFKNIRELTQALDHERNILEKVVRKSIQDLYESYSYLLELEVEKRRGEDDKHR